MAISNNPNKTKGIEKRWRKDAKRRFRALRAQMLEIPLNTEMKLNISDGKRIDIERFMFEFERIAKALIILSPWQEGYQTESYQRGIERANRDLKRIIRDPNSEFFGLVHGQSIVSLSLSSNVNQLGFLHKRAQEALEKWYKQLLSDTNSILNQQLGIVPVNEIHEAITERINSTLGRSYTIAQTEIAQASQTSVITQTQELSSRIDKNLEVRWITVFDDVVRHLHRGWHGQLMSTEQASRNITISPFNCRCALQSVDPENISKRESERFEEERKILLSMPNS